MIIHKHKRIRDEKHRKAIRQLPCLSCGATPSQAAHIRVSGHGGMGLKPDDDCCVPLCHNCHALQHNVGEVTFYYRFGGHEVAKTLAKKLYETSGDIPVMLTEIARWKRNSLSKTQT